MVTISAFGAIMALVVAIFLIFKKVPPAYSMLMGALIGGILGGADLAYVVEAMITGAQGITTAVMRILAAGVLAGVLIESGAASTIARAIVKLLGESRALLALVLATMLLTAVGVFIDVAVITVSPIALALGRQGGYSNLAVLLAMSGGGKAGNIISPNPNTIAVADAFHLPLTSVMIAGIIPAIVGLILTYFFAKRLAGKGASKPYHGDFVIEHHDLPRIFPALVAPLVSMFLLALRPLFDIQIDPLIALPTGGIVGTLCMKKGHEMNHFVTVGLSKMMPVAIMLLGTGALAGIIGNSGLKDVIINGLTESGLPSYLLAPISGILMSLATSSTTAGAVVASNVFSETLLELGIGGLAAAAMIQVGSTVGDHLPHGSFFHATGGSLSMSIQERLKIIPQETFISLLMTLISVLIFGVLS